MSSVDDKSYFRKIKSFVLREGRLTPRQQLAIDSLSVKFCLPLNKPLDIPAVFSREAKTILEIGFGMGDSLAEQAAAHPEVNFIGVEVHKPGVGALLATMQDSEVNNIRIYHADAVEVLKTCVVDNSLDGVQIFFPDPWHKRKHHKRRLIQLSFADALAKKIKAGGVLHLATDWEHYAEHMLKEVSASTAFKNMTEAYMPRPDWRPLSKFEKRGLKLGHGVWDLMFQRCY